MLCVTDVLSCFIVRSVVCIRGLKIIIAVIVVLAVVGVVVLDFAVSCWSTN